MQSRNVLLLLLIAFILLLILPAASAENKSIDFFYSKTCPHCKAEKLFLENLQKEHPELNVDYHVVWNGNETNDNLFKEVAAKFNTTATSVPRTIIGDKMFIGFTEATGPCEQKGSGYIGYQNQIQDEILKLIGAEKQQCETQEKISIFKTALFTILIPIILFLGVFAIFRKKLALKYWLSIFIALAVVCLFVFTKTIPSEQVVESIKTYPLPLFTLIIGLLDGFNPCAMFVLSFLLALLVYTGSRKKMALIGLTFILTSGVMYFIYMLVLLGVLNTPLFESNKFILRIAVGIVAVIAGAINIKDFFAFKKGISLTISEKHKTGIFSRMRDIVNKMKEAEAKRALLIGVLATIVLAAVVNVIELACTLFFPLIYTTVLTANVKTFAGQALYIAFYNVFYIIPLLAIFGAFMYSLKSNRLTEKQGKVLKLIGGLMMLILGLILLLKPELLAFR